MNLVDLLWIGSIGAASIILLIVAIVFFAQEGRARLHLARLLFALTLLAATSLFTAIESGTAILFWFKLPRAIAWLIVAIAGAFLLLFQLGIVNGQKAK